MARYGVDPVAMAMELRDAGVRLLQYRDKRGAASVDEVLLEARRLAECLRGSGCQLILNDFADLVVESGFGGLHVGQGDLDPAAARAMLGAEYVLGVSTHNAVELQRAAVGTADYVAIGPVFQTSTKANAEAAVGLEGVRLARVLTNKPLVAIGGITVERIAAVMEAGADAVAVIGALLREGRSIGEDARELLQVAEEHARPSAG